MIARFRGEQELARRAIVRFWFAAWPVAWISGLATPADSPMPADTATPATICELNAHPALHDGELVRVKARMYRFVHFVGVGDAHASTYCAIDPQFGALSGDALSQLEAAFRRAMEQKKMVITELTGIFHRHSERGKGPLHVRGLDGLEVMSFTTLEIAEGADFVPPLPARQKPVENSR